MIVRTIGAEAEDAGERIDTFLAAKTGITRSQIQKLIDRGDVIVNGRAVSPNYRIKKNDVAKINSAEKEGGALLAESIPLDILYEDEDIVVLNKSAGMVVYPAAGHYSGTLMNALAHHCRRLASAGSPLRPGVVHRLDKDTSGVLVVALTDEAYYDLVEQFRQRTIKRKYIAFVYGNPGEDEGEISSKIGRSASDRKKMSTRVRRGKEAHTRWKVISRLGMVTVAEVKLSTGRTHQIRVHFASIGHPVLGDRIYGRKMEIEKKRKRISFPRQMLHAALLGFKHPLTGEYLEFSSPLPEDMLEKIRELEAAAF
jgi:23S rRNA pseudouridine1911/1915/1917 synthase